MLDLLWQKIEMNEQQLSSLKQNSLLFNICNNSLSNTIAKLVAIDAELKAEITSSLQTINGFEYMLNYALFKGYRTINLFYNKNDFIYTVSNTGIEQYFNLMTYWLVNKIIGVHNIPNMHLPKQSYEMEDDINVVDYTKIDCSCEIDQNFSIDSQIRHVFSKLGLHRYRIKLTRFYGCEKINGTHDGYHLQFMI